MKNESPRLLAIMELGGYPNLAPLYKRLGFESEVVNSQRKAQAYLKKRIPDVIVAEYNFQSDFRDRTSNLETLMARLQRHLEAASVENLGLASAPGHLLVDRVAEALRAQELVDQVDQKALQSGSLAVLSLLQKAEGRPLLLSVADLDLFLPAAGSGKEGQEKKGAEDHRVSSRRG